jgi:hypothetical protein
MIVKTIRPQFEFLKLPQKYRLFVGGFGSSKTFTGTLARIAHAYQFPKINQGYFAPTFTHVRDIFYPTIDECAFLTGMTAEIKYGNREVELYSGGSLYSVIKCRSLNNPGDIIGFKIGSALIDEFDLLEKEKALLAWRKILGRMRYKVDGVKNGIDVATTPEGFKATYDIFEVRGNREDYVTVKASTHENEKNLPEGYIQSLKDEYPAALLSAYLHGEYVNLAYKTVYYGYDRSKNNTSETVQEGENIYMGMDFNIDKMAASIFVKRKDNKHHYIDEIVDAFDTPAIINIIKSRYPRNNITVYPDSSGKNRDTRGGGASNSDISLLRQAGFSVRAKDGNPPVKDRVAASNKRLESKHVLVNHNKCPRIAECLEKQAYDKNGEPDKKSGFDHQNDATTYPQSYEFPINKPISRVPVRFIN